MLAAAAVVFMTAVVLTVAGVSDPVQVGNVMGESCDRLSPNGCAGGASSPVAPSSGNLEMIVVDDQDKAFSDGRKRFARSASVLGYKFHAVSSFEDFKKAIDALKSKAEAVLLYIENSHDVVLAAPEAELMQKFAALDAPIVSSVSLFCRYKSCKIEGAHRTFPNVKYVMGYASAFGKAVNESTNSLESVLVTLRARPEYGLKLDDGHVLFQELGGYGEDLSRTSFSLVDADDNPRLMNNKTGARACVIIGGGNNLLLNQIGNYVPKAFTRSGGCLSCASERVTYDTASLLPALYVAFFVEQESPFLEEALGAVAQQIYPKKSIHMTYYLLDGPSNTKLKPVVQDFANNHTEYASSKVVDGFDISRAVMDSLVSFASQKDEAAMYMQLSSLVYLSDRSAFRHLVSQNRGVISPIVSHDGKWFSNFWGSIQGDFDAQCFDFDQNCHKWTSSCTASSEEATSAEGTQQWMQERCPKTCNLCTGPKAPHQVQYARSFDYLEMVSREIVGVFNVPYVTSAILMKREAAMNLLYALDDYSEATSQSDLTDRFTFNVLQSRLLRQKHSFLFVDNQIDFGMLINTDGYDHSHLHPSMYLIEHNRRLWQKVYAHEDYLSYKNTSHLMGRCWDVYVFPMFSPKFCTSLIEEAENYGQWSSGDYNDKRLKGGYEPVPTRDIHFHQLGFDKAWYEILHQIVAPPAEFFFTGYKLRGKYTLDFIVKYRPDGQPALRPHHDASSVTINVALNRGGGVDYDGGGCRFIRQDCQCVNLPLGNAVMFPGRVTHQHEGLKTTAGTRYILVSFIDQ